MSTLSIDSATRSMRRPQTVEAHASAAPAAAPDVQDLVWHPDSLLNLKRASAFLGVSVPTLYRWVRTDPNIKLVRIGKRCTRMRAGDALALAQKLAQQAVA